MLCTFCPPLRCTLLGLLAVPFSAPSLYLLCISLRMEYFADARSNQDKLFNMSHEWRTRPAKRTPGSINIVWTSYEFNRIRSSITRVAPVELGWLEGKRDTCVCSYGIAGDELESGSRLRTVSSSRLWEPLVSVGRVPCAYRSGCGCPWRPQFAPAQRNFSHFAQRRHHHNSSPRVQLP